MDFPLSSSTVLGAAVLLWLLWGAPYLLRRARPASDGAILLSEASESEPPSATTLPSATTSPTPGRRSPEEGQHVTDRNPAVGKLRIRWGRCVLAVGGLAGLLLAAVGGILAALHVAHATVPLAGLAATIVSVVVLRRLAVGDRRRRLDARRASHATADSKPEVQTERRVVSEVFDHQPEPEPARPALSRDQLRAAALEVARAAQAAAAEAAIQTGVEERETWDPVEVPKPSYMDAAKADRGAPEAMEKPEEPKPAGKVTIKPKPEAEEVPGVPLARPTARGALGNLDAVLQRRRA